MELMRGNGSPRRTLRSRASDEGRVLVGSSPTRLYIVLTAAISSGGCIRTVDSAAASGALRRGSRSTTVAPSSHSTPGRRMTARLGASVKRIDVGWDGVDVRLGVGGNDSPHAFAEFLRVETSYFASIDWIVHDEPNNSRIGG